MIALEKIVNCNMASLTRRHGDNMRHEGAQFSFSQCAQLSRSVCASVCACVCVSVCLCARVSLYVCCRQLLLHRHNRGRCSLIAVVAAAVAVAVAAVAVGSAPLLSWQPEATAACRALLIQEPAGQCACAARAVYVREPKPVIGKTDTPTPTTGG